jgi:hypothetical protein
VSQGKGAEERPVKLDRKEIEGADMIVLGAPLDFSDESEEPEKLAAACLAWKGSCDELEEPQGKG